MFDDTFDQNPDGTPDEQPDELEVASDAPETPDPDTPQPERDADADERAPEAPAHDAGDDDGGAPDESSEGAAEHDAADATVESEDEDEDEGPFLPPLDADAAAFFGLSDEQLGITREMPVTPESSEPESPAESPAEPPSEPTRTGDEPVFARRRRTLFPRWLVPSLIASIVVIALGTVLAIQISQSGLVEVPQVVGLSVSQAQLKLAEAGLRMVTTDSRYSSAVPKGGVLSQNPSPGDKIKRGARVGIVVSVGSETVQMPDVIGMPIADAQRVLSSLGLRVSVDHVAAEDATPNVVLSSIPSPGMNVSTSDVVRLTTAGSSDTSSSSLLPYKLSGTSFALDPAPVPAGVPDAPVEVARRLRALLEASGARVTVTRSVADTDTSAGGRAARAAEASPTAIVGIDVSAAGPGGLGVLSIPASRAAQPNYRSSLKLADAMLDALRIPGEQPQQLLPIDDAIAFSTAAPGVRLQLGSAAAPGDRLALTDPDRNDAIARAIYRALGSLYGKR